MNRISQQIGEWLFRLLSPANRDVVAYDSTSRTFKNRTLAALLVAGDLPTHGAAEHTDRTRYTAVSFHNVAYVNAAESDTGWVITGLTTTAAVYFPLLDRASDSQDVAVGTFVVPGDYASGGTLHARFMSDGNIAGDAVVRLAEDVLAVGADATTLGVTSDQTIAMSGSTDFPVEATAVLAPAGLAVGELVNVRISRRPTNAADVYIGEVRLIGAWWEYTADG